MQSRGHIDANYMSGTCLALCLIKMYAKFQHYWFTSNVKYDHPIVDKYQVKLSRVYRDGPVISDKLNQIVNLFGKQAPFSDVSCLPLLNSSIDSEMFQAEILRGTRSFHIALSRILLRQIKHAWNE